MNRASVLGLVLLGLLLGGCTSSDRAAIVVPQPEARGPWTNLAANNDPAEFHFAIVADRTGGMRPGVFESAIDKLNLLQPEFVLCVGDLIPGYSEDRQVLQTQWTDLDAVVGKLQMPFFYVPGNHDLSNATQDAVWLQRYGRSYYHFVYRDVLFLCLDTIDAQNGMRPDRVDDTQFAYFKKALDDNPGVRWTFVFMHYPLWAMKSGTGRWPDLQGLLAQRRHTVFAGHWHSYTKYRRGQASYISLATTGGNSTMQGDYYGTFDHLVWVTMKRSGPVVANLMLDGIRDDNIRDEATKDFVSQLARGRMVKIDPVYVQLDDAQPPQTVIRVINDTDLPMKFAGTFQPGGSLVATPATIEKTLAPHTAQVAEVQLKLDGRPTPATFKQLVFKGTCTYTAAGRPDLVVPWTKMAGRLHSGRSWVVEAEDLDLGGDYRIARHPAGRAVIFVEQRDGAASTGTARTAFPGPDGRYKVTLIAVPEAEGAPTIEVLLAGTSVLKQTLPKEPKPVHWWEEKLELSTKQIQLHHGDEIRIVGAGADDAEALVDALIFEPVEEQAAP